jgi:hypothetical protein
MGSTRVLTTNFHGVNANHTGSHVEHTGVHVGHHRRLQVAELRAEESSKRSFEWPQGSMLAVDDESDRPFCV